MDLRDQLSNHLGSSLTIERELSGGGMSRVFVAEDRGLGRKVVIKVLPTEMAAAVSIERFKREIGLAARLQHPHIVPLLTAGETGGVPYFTMPFVEGESLRVRLMRHGELPIAEAMRILREVASALAYAHGRGVVHRDIKPDNILLSGGSAMVTDFGVAKALSASSNSERGSMTSLGVALGTPAYMAPEQASADPAIDHRADIYAFGVLAFEVLTGQPPFAGRTPQGLLAAHVTEAPEQIANRRANIPPALAALVMRCLEKRPADRPQSADDVVHALDDITTPSGGMQPTSAGRAVNRTDGVRGMSTISRLRGAAIVSMIAALALFAILRMKRPATATASATPQSVAILPVVNAGGDTSVQFFAAGMTDELTAAIAKVPGLRVASRSATEATKSTDPRRAGTALGVGAVLESRMRRDASQMALTVELINVADGLSLWSGSYHAEVKDAFAVQDSVARAVAGALKIALSPAQQTGIVRARTTNPKAHDLYLRGRFAQSEFTGTSLKRSIDLFRQAIAEDSTYAAPYSGIADSWLLLADDFVRASDVIAQERTTVQRGLALDADSPELHNSLGQLEFWYERKLDDGMREMSQALTIKFDVANGAYYLATAALENADRDSAIALARHMIAFDSTNTDLIEAAGYVFILAHADADARRACRRNVMQRPASIRCRNWLWTEDGHVDSAIATTRNALIGFRAAGRPTAASESDLVGLLVAHGDTGAARQVVNEMDAEYNKHYVREDYIAIAHGWLGDVPNALAYLERGKRSLASGLSVLYVNWAPVPAHRDPRIRAFIKANALGKEPAGW